MIQKIALGFLALFSISQAAYEVGTYEVYGQYDYGSLIISESSEKAFSFSVNVVKGPTFHTGEISGDAVINDNGTATALIPKEYSDGVCRIDFQLGSEKKLSIVVEEDYENCSEFHGMRASFDGDYIKVSDIGSIHSQEEFDLSEAKYFTPSIGHSTGCREELNVSWYKDAKLGSRVHSTKTLTFGCYEEESPLVKEYEENPDFRDYKVISISKSITGSVLYTLQLVQVNFENISNGELALLVDHRASSLLQITDKQDRPEYSSILFRAQGKIHYFSSMVP